MLFYQKYYNTLHHHTQGTCSLLYHESCVFSRKFNLAKHCFLEPFYSIAFIIKRTDLHCFTNPSLFQLTPIFNNCILLQRGSLLTLELIRLQTSPFLLQFYNQFINSICISALFYKTVSQFYQCQYDYIDLIIIEFESLLHRSLPLSLIGNTTCFANSAHASINVFSASPHAFRLVSESIFFDLLTIAIKVLTAFIRISLKA